MGQVAHLLDVFVPKNYQLYFDINRQTKKISGVTKISGRALKNWFGPTPKISKH